MTTRSWRSIWIRGSGRDREWRWRTKAEFGSDRFLPAHDLDQAVQIEAGRPAMGTDCERTLLTRLPWAR